MVINDKEMFDFYEKIAHEEKCIFGKKETSTCSRQSISAFDVSKRYDNLCILHNGEEASEILLMVDNVLSIFDDYFSEIPGLNHLLASNYTDIEVAMFLQHKDDGSPGRQRDHFTHQFRNAYIGIIMLEDLNIIENVIKNLKKSDSFLNLNFDFNSFLAEENQSEALLKEFIYKTYFITALFHDIGYPLSHFMETVERIHNYPPFFKMVNSNIKTSFVDISAMLMNSLLFKIVKKSEIEEKYLKNDHGCLSAISFLTQFYNNGIIFSLGKMNKAIIEWAALAIFNHTNKYDGSRMLFADDPISFMHRICDDLQEWNRFSVILQETSNYLRCPKCKNIIRKVGNNKSDYECSCSDNGDGKYEKITTIKSKKLNYIELCEEMEISRNKENIVIQIDYNLYKQIQLMINDFSSIEYRKKDLEKVKKMLLFQEGFACVELNYFLGNDIEEIKMHLEDVNFIDKKLRSSNEYKKLLEKLGEEIPKIKYKKNDINAKREYQEQQIECVKNLLPFFYDLDKKQTLLKHNAISS